MAKRIVAFVLSRDGVLGLLRAVPVGETTKPAPPSPAKSFRTLPGIDPVGARFAERQGLVVQGLLDLRREVGDHRVGLLVESQRLLVAGIPAGDDDRSGFEVAGADLDADAGAAQLPVVVFEARLSFLALVDVDAQRQAVVDFPDPEAGARVSAAPRVAARVSSSRPIGTITTWTGASFGGAMQALVVAVGHDQGADQARGNAPRRRLDVLKLPSLDWKAHVERLGEVLAEVVRGSGLERA